MKKFTKTFLTAVMLFFCVQYAGAHGFQFNGTNAPLDVGDGANGTGLIQFYTAGTGTTIGLYVHIPTPQAFNSFTIGGRQNASGFRSPYVTYNYVASSNTIVRAVYAGANNSVTSINHTVILPNGVVKIGGLDADFTGNGTTTFTYRSKIIPKATFTISGEPVNSATTSGLSGTFSGGYPSATSGTYPNNIQLLLNVNISNIPSNITTTYMVVTYNLINNQVGFEEAEDPTAPKLTATPSSITFTPSNLTKPFDLTGKNLTGNLTLTATGGYTFAGGATTMNVTIEQDGTLAVPTTINVTSNGSSSIGGIYVTSTDFSNQKIVDLDFNIPNTICEWEYKNPDSQNAWVTFSWVTKQDGTIEISIHPHPANAGGLNDYAYFRNDCMGRASHDGFTINGVPNALSTYFTFSTSYAVGKPAGQEFYDKVILTPKPGNPLAQGSIIKFNGLVEYKTTDLLGNGNGGTTQGGNKWPDIEFPDFSYGADCGHLPSVTATPNELNFTPGNDRKSFTITGLNLNPNIPLKFVASSGFNVTPPIVGIQSDGTVGATTINVTCIEASANGYITISGGGLLRPVKVKLTTSGFSEYCKKIISTENNGWADLAYLTIETSANKKEIYFRIAPIPPLAFGKDAYWPSHKNRVGTVTAGGQTATVTYSDYDHLATAVFTNPLTDGTTVNFGNALVWGVKDPANSIDNDNCYINGISTYISGTDCFVTAPTTFPFEVRGLFNEWNNGWEMIEIGNTGVYSVTINLPADTHKFKVLKDGIPPPGDERTFISNGSPVTFYAKDLGSSGWLFVCDQQDIFVVGDATGGSDFNDNALLLQYKTDTAQHFVGYLDGLDYMLKVKDFNGLLTIDNDVMNAVRSDLFFDGMYVITFDYATFNVTPYLIYESVGETNVYVGTNAGAGALFKANSSETSPFETDPLQNLGTFIANSNPLYIGGELQMQNPLYNTVSDDYSDLVVKMHYQIDALAPSEIILEHIATASNIGAGAPARALANGNELWQNPNGVNVLSGLGLSKGTHNIKVWYEVRAFGLHIYADDNGGNGYNALFNVDDTPTSLDYVTQNVLIYPNPVKDILYISGLSEATDIKIVDITGKAMLRCLSVAEGKIVNQIDVSSLEKGVYFIGINNKFVKFIKK